MAGIATVYHRDSHADVILGKILEGYNQQGGPGPALKLMSLYVDQFPKADLSRDLVRKYKVPIFKTIEEAVTVGGNGIPVATSFIRNHAGTTGKVSGNYRCVKHLGIDLVMFAANES